MYRHSSFSRAELALPTPFRRVRADRHFLGRAARAVALGVAVLGCGSAQDSEVATTQTAIEGGTLVGSSNNSLPYSATVRIGPPPVGDDAGIEVCSGVKIGPLRYLTAAHCVDAWTGNQTGQVVITNVTDPPTNPSNSDVYIVTQVHVHPTWIAAGNSDDAIVAKDFVGRPQDIAIFDVDRTNTIPALTTNGVPKINPTFVDTGWWSRMVGYGSLGDPKAWFDQVASTSPAEDFDPTDGFDLEASSYTHIFWNWEGRGTPRGEPGDSGAPVFNEGSGGWWISGVVSGAYFFASRISRAESVINWIKNPTAISATAGSAGYLINAKSALCLSPQSGVIKQWPCVGNSTQAQVWTLQTTDITNRYRVRSGSGKCLAIPEGNNSSGTAAQFSDCTTSNYQKWQLVDRGALDALGGGNTAPGYRYYQLKIHGNGTSNLCLEPNGGSVVIAEALKQVTCATITTPTAHRQAWAFTRR